MSVPTAPRFLTVDGLVKNDRYIGGYHPLDVVEATGQIYCPSAVGVHAVAHAKPRAHLFVHKMAIGSVIALPVLDAEPLDGYASDDTDAEYEYFLDEALLVRITSDVKAGPMKGRSLIRNASDCSHHSEFQPYCWMCRSSVRRLLLNETAEVAAATAAATAAAFQKRLSLESNPPRYIVEDFVALHRDVEVLGRVNRFGCEDPHYFEWNYGGVMKCTQTRVYTKAIQK
jgi:hypothetical protein